MATELAGSAGTHAWPELTTTGTTAPVANPGLTALALFYVVSGSPASLSVQLEGSADGTNFFALASAGTSTSGGVITVSGVYAPYLRANLTALSGGSSPSVTATLTGAPR